MSETIRVAILYVAFFVVYGIALTFTVLLFRYILFDRSFRKSLYYCMRYKWVVALFSLGYTLLFAVLDIVISTPYIYYILPGVSVLAALLIAKGIIPTLR